MLTTMTVEDIRKRQPCYDPVTGLDAKGRIIHPGGFLPENWQGTALDILKVEKCPSDDRLWVVLRQGWIPDDVYDRFARWCALQVAHLWETPMPDVLRQYLETGGVSLRAAARTAAWAAGAAAQAAWYAAGAARTAAWAARDAAWAAWYAAWYAAGAARDAAGAAAGATRAAAWAARDAAREDQVAKLIELLEEYQA